MEMSNAVLPCFSSCTAPSRLSSNVGSSIEFTMLPGLGQRAKSADFQRSTSKTVYHSVPPAGKTKQKHHEPEQPSNLNDHNGLLCATARDRSTITSTLAPSLSSHNNHPLDAIAPFSRGGGLSLQQESGWCIAPPPEQHAQPPPHLPVSTRVVIRIKLIMLLRQRRIRQCDVECAKVCQALNAALFRRGLVVPQAAM